MLSICKERSLPLDKVDSQIESWLKLLLLLIDVTNFPDNSQHLLLFFKGPVMMNYTRVIKKFVSST